MAEAIDKKNNECWEIRYKNGGQEVDAIVGQGKLARFSFEAVRKKDSDTKLEKLVIRAKFDQVDYGEMVTSIGKLNTDILKLADYGINLSLKEFRDLAKKIDNHFYDLPLETVQSPSGITDEILEGMLDFVNAYVREDKDGINKADDCYNIPSVDFKKAYDDSDFSTVYQIKLTDMKQALREKGYIKCNRYRTDRTVKFEKETRKCISFVIKYVDDRKGEGEK